MKLQDLTDMICDTEIFCRSNGAVRILVLENGMIRAQATQTPHNGETVAVISEDATNGILFTEAANWLKDCFQSDECQEEIDDCSPIELMGAVNKYYDHGLAEFLAAWN